LPVARPQVFVRGLTLSVQRKNGALQLTVAAASLTQLPHDAAPPPGVGGALRPRLEALADWWAALPAGSQAAAFICRSDPSHKSACLCRSYGGRCGATRRAEPLRIGRRFDGKAAPKRPAGAAAGVAAAKRRKSSSISAPAAESPATSEGQRRLSDLWRGPAAPAAGEGPSVLVGRFPAGARVRYDDGYGDVFDGVVREVSALEDGRVMAKVACTPRGSRPRILGQGLELIDSLKDTVGFPFGGPQTQDSK
jgi:hypothetical protein